MSRVQRGISPNVPIPALLGAMDAAQPFDARAIPAGVQGMDVSGWQAAYPAYAVSQVNWAQQWSMGSRFVYVKATEGDYFVDASRTSHLKGATAVGMLHGAYHFALPNQSSAVAQADFFLKNGGSWKADGNTLPPLLDMENNPYANPTKTPYYGNNCYNMTPAAMVSWIKAFSNRVLSQTGRLPAIYTNYYWWQECTGDSQDFANQPLHIAAYGASFPWIPGGWKSYQFWQYSDTGPFDGDSNVWNGTLASLKAFSKATDAPVPTPSISSVADLIAADSSGTLWSYPATGMGSYGARKKIGVGWTGLRSINVIDWDANGTLDIVAQWSSGRVSLYRGLPGGGFGSPATLAASGWGDYQLVVGYWLNSSAYPQILTRSSTGDLRLWSNPSGSALASSRQIGNGWATLNLTMVDFDGDRKQDLLAQDQAGKLRLYRSNGAGSLVAETRPTVGVGWANFTSLTVYSDFTAPGSVGLVARNTSGALIYYPVPGTAKFGAASTVGKGFATMLIAGGDNINLAPPVVPTPSNPTPTPAPSKPKPTPSIVALSDVVAVDASGNLMRSSVDKAVLGKAVKIGAGFKGTKSIHVTDWNADGVLDLLVQWSNGKLTLYRGGSSGGFTAVVLAASGWSDPDLTVGAWIKGAKYPSILSRQPDGKVEVTTTTSGTTLTASKRLGTGFVRMHPVMGDFDSDGNADLAVVNNVGQLVLYRSNGKGALISEARPVIGVGWSDMKSISPARGFTSASSQGFLALSSSGSLSYYPVAKSKFGQPVVLATGWGSYGVSGSSVILKQRSIPSLADLVTADSNGALWNYPATGTGNLGNRFQIGTGWAGVKSLNVLDWNSDGIPDLLSKGKDGSLKVYLGAATGGFARVLTLSSKGWETINFVTGPWLSGSKYPSLVGANASGNLYVWANKTGGYLSKATQIGNGWGGLKLAMLDFDKNGTQDILAVDRSGYMKLYRSTGQGNFVPQNRPTVGNGWGIVDQFSGTAGYQGPGSTGVMTILGGNQPRYYPLVSAGLWAMPRNSTDKVTGTVISR